MAHAIDFDPKTAWDGGKSPFRVSYGKMFMWFFLISDALTFGGLLCAYGFARHAHADEWALAENVFTHFPFIDKHVPLAYVGLMTFILIMSSVTMVLAVEAGHRMNKKGVMIWLFLTIIGGLMFVGSQAWEWWHFIEGTPQGGMVPQVDPETGERVVKQFFGANLIVNEYGGPQFADFFFFITGFHGTHVFSGVVINIIIFINVVRGVYQRRGHYEMVEKVGLYWHFVDLVWVFVFTFFYLL
jgi:cytochrome c oxidase subunit III